MHTFGKHSILIAGAPGNTGTQSILITWDPGNTGTQYMFMHVEYDQFNYQKNKRKVLEYYETIYLHRDIPYVINASQYKDRTLRFHLNGYTEKIQL